MNTQCSSFWIECSKTALCTDIGLYLFIFCRILSMTRVLFLFTQTEMETAEELKDVLQARLGSAVNLTSSLDVIAEDSSLKEEVHQSRCIVLIYSQQCEEYLNKGTKEIEDGYVTFDGSFIKACLKENDVISKTLVVHFGQEPEKLISTRVPESPSPRTERMNN